MHRLYIFIFIHDDPSTRKFCFLCMLCCYFSAVINPLKTRLKTLNQSEIFIHIVDLFSLLCVGGTDGMCYSMLLLYDVCTFSFSLCIYRYDYAQMPKISFGNRYARLYCLFHYEEKSSSIVCEVFVPVASANIKFHTVNVKYWTFAEQRTFIRVKVAIACLTCQWLNIT